jgi:hypothetical protein
MILISLSQLSHPAFTNHCTLSSSPSAYFNSISPEFWSTEQHLGSEITDRMLHRFE